MLKRYFSILAFGTDRRGYEELYVEISAQEKCSECVRKIENSKVSAKNMKTKVKEN